MFVSFIKRCKWGEIKSGNRFFFGKYKQKQNGLENPLFGPIGKIADDDDMS